MRTLIVAVACLTELDALLTSCPNGQSVTLDRSSCVINPLCAPPLDFQPGSNTCNICMAGYHGPQIRAGDTLLASECIPCGFSFYSAAGSTLQAHCQQCPLGSAVSSDLSTCKCFDPDLSFDSKGSCFPLESLTCNPARTVDDFMIGRCTCPQGYFSIPTAAAEPAMSSYTWSTTAGWCDSVPNGLTSCRLNSGTPCDTARTFNSTTQLTTFVYCVSGYSQRSGTDAPTCLDARAATHACTDWDYMKVGIKTLNYAGKCISFTGHYGYYGAKPQCSPGFELNGTMLAQKCILMTSSATSRGAALVVLSWLVANLI